MSEQFQIKRATRSQTKLRLAFTGASFAGKTTASLLLAKGLIDAMVAAGTIPASQDVRIGLIDSERKRAQLYSHLVPFDTIELDPPFTIERYLAAMHQFENAGYQVIIIDSASHAWVGQGGVLSTVGEGFQAWKKATPLQDEFIDSIMRSPAHMIVTMRSKTEWVVEKVTNKAGKEVNSPRRIGMAPVQRAGVEYEFTTLLDLQLTQERTRKIEVHKDNTGVFEAMQIKTPGDWSVAGKNLIEWMNSGAVVKSQDTGPSPLEQAEAICQAAERQLPRCSNLPDLAKMFEGYYKRLREMAGQLDPDDAQSLRERVVAAKDKRKADFGATTPQPTGAVITPDDVDALDAMFMLGGIPLSAFSDEFGVPRLAMLPYDQWDQVVSWAIQVAGANGCELKRPTRVMPDAPPCPTSKDTINAVIDRIAGEKHDLLSQ
jgi:hypothetical protein